jgi:hypothetical protein
MPKVFRCDCEGVSEWVVAEEIESARAFLNEEHDFDFADSEYTQLVELSDKEVDELMLYDLSKEPNEEGEYPQRPAREMMKEEETLPYSLASTEF